VLQVQNLHKSYGPTSVLSGVSFVLNDGERLGLIGPNGTVKSTLLRCVAGLETPDRGRVVSRPPNATIGYLPQAFGAGDTRTVDEVVSGLAHEWQWRSTLDGLDLDPTMGVDKLSGGQKTRLGLATLLLGQPDVLLLD